MSILRVSIFSFAFFLFINSQAFALSSLFRSPCSEEFLGEVVEIIEPAPPINSLSKNSVVFKNLKTFKGDLEETEVIPLLKFGGLNLEVGKVYHIKRRNKRICSITPHDDFS
jgi:hypothetical protein